MNRAVTIRCVVCGLEVTGVKMRDGTVRPSDRSRSTNGQAIERGYCVRDMPK